MNIQVLVNETVKQFLVHTSSQKRKLLRKAFEFLEAGLWDGGLKIKKLKSASHKTILEGRVTRADRLLFTLGKTKEDKLLIYVWGIAAHDDVGRKARAIIPSNAPFLFFTEYEERELEAVDLETLESSCFTQESIEEKVHQETGPQKWFILDDAGWKRLLLYGGKDFEIFLYLTQEQKKLLSLHPPVLLSGTAGSGKTTLAIYYLLNRNRANQRALFLTYNTHLKNFSERLYHSLKNIESAYHLSSAPTDDCSHYSPEFLTFKEFCFRLLPEKDTTLKSEKEVDAFVFTQLLKKNKAAEKYDPPLVWEEIRSIIKGAKPQVNTASLMQVAGKIKDEEINPELIDKVREELLQIQNLGIYEKANKAVQNILGLNLSQTSREIEKVLEQNRDAFLRAMQNILSLLSNYEANYSSPLMTLMEYEQLGRKRAPHFLHNRQDIYAIAQWYQQECKVQGLWDEIDLTRSAIRILDNPVNSVSEYDLVCCDEIQDFTDLQMSLIMRLPVHPGSVFLAGDLKQIVNPSGFRWEEVKKLFYDRGMVVPSVHSLTLNFRCTGSIVLLSNALLELKRKILGIYHDESLDEWKMQGRPPFVIHGINEQTIIEHLTTQAAYQAILTRSQEECDALKSLLQTELIFTIREAKGLEFKTVLLWKFCNDQRYKDVWAKILNYKTADIHDAFIRYEFNLLYVGLTRAQQNLFIYDGEYSSPLWESPTLKDHIFKTTELEFFQQTWFSISTPEEWKNQGNYFFEHEHFKAAAECYRNAEELLLMHKALAHHHEKRAEYLQAGESWEKAEEYPRAANAYEKAEAYSLALLIWETLGKKQETFRCTVRILEQENRFEELAELMWNNKKEKEAIEYWKKAGNFERIACYYETKKKFKEAADAFVAMKEYHHAAQLYLKAKAYQLAAICFEQALLYQDALELWKKLKNKDGIHRCILKINDPVKLAQFYEQTGEWEKALHAYQSVMNDALQIQIQKEIQNIPGGKKGYPLLAIRYTLLKNNNEAALYWRKTGRYTIAAPLFVEAKEYLDAGHCYQESGDWVQALKCYGLSNYPDLLAHHIKQLPKTVKKERLIQELKSITDKLLKEKCFASALDSFLFLKDSTSAALCTASMEDPEKAVSLWGKNTDFRIITKFFDNQKLYHEGAMFFCNLLYNHKYNETEFWKLMSAFEELLRSWWIKQCSKETRIQISEILDKARVPFPLDFIIEIQEPLCEYDNLRARIKGCGYFKADGLQHIIEDWKKTAIAMEKASRFDAAGFRYLCINLMDDARRCYNKVPINENNYLSIAEVGLLDEVIDHFVSNKNYLQAATIANNFENYAAAAELFLKEKMPSEAANAYEQAKNYQSACDLYLKMNNSRKAALMLEKMKKYEEAARLWKSIGNQKNYKKCKENAYLYSHHQHSLPLK